jgi:hypothetical protein
MRRLPKFAMAAMASLAMFALAATAATAETVVKKKEFETSVTAAFTQTSPTGEEYANPSGTFSGKVTSSKNKCVKSGRSVTVKPPTGPNVGQTTSNGSTGDWTLNGTNLTPGNYSVSVDKFKIVKEKDKPNGTHVKKKIVCLPVTATVAVS